jgi:hypothetical protein
MVSRFLNIPAVLLLAACPAPEPELTPVLADLGPFTPGDEVVCDDPFEGWSRFSEEAAERGVTGALAGLPTGEVFDGFSSVVVHDLDADGDLDIVGGQLNGLPQLWWNDGAGFFTAGELPGENDDPPGYRTAAADLDGDGLPELLVQGERLRVWRNRGADFDEPVQYAPPYEGRLAGLALGDPDRDGDLDALIVTSIAGPGTREGPPNLLLLGDGLGGFEVGTNLPVAGPGVSSLVAIFTDRDLDGDVDLLVPSNTSDLLPQTTSFFRNDTEIGGQLVLVDDAEALAVTQPIAGMGVDSMDINRDGFLDYCVTDTGPPVCWLSQDVPGSPYLDGGLIAGLVPILPAYDSPAVPDTIGWSIDFADLDHDGHPDVLHASAPDNGSGFRAQGYVLWPNLVFAGGPDGFVDVTQQTGLGEPQSDFGLATGDLDGDGSLDVVVAGPGRPLHIHMNRCSAGAWLDLELVGPPGNREGYGTIAWLEDSRGTQIRELYAVRALGQGPSRLHFGLGDDDVARSLRVRWPDGSEAEAFDLPLNRRYTLEHEAR